MGKFLLGSVANIYLGKVTEAFQKIQAVLVHRAVVRKPGLRGGVNYPHLQHAG